MWVRKWKIEKLLLATNRNPNCYKQFGKLSVSASFNKLHTLCMSLELAILFLSERTTKIHA